MNINILFLESKNDIFKSTQRKVLRELIKRHVDIAQLSLKISPTNISVYPNKDWCIPEIGIGGYTASEDWIQLSLNLSTFDKNIEKYLPAVIYHEMHHTKRMSTVGYGESLLEVSITEGLATKYAEEKFPQFSPPWGKYSKSEITKLVKPFLKHKDDVVDFSEWFLGYGKPHWLGYKVGSYIINSVLEKNHHLSSLRMVDFPSKKIFDMYNE